MHWMAEKYIYVCKQDGGKSFKYEEEPERRNNIIVELDYNDTLVESGSVEIVASELLLVRMVRSAPSGP